MGSLFGGRVQGPTEAEKAMQRDRYVEANRADVEADQKVALAARAASLRKSLAYRDQSKKGTLGG
ncbi:hypothetical protein NA8A_04803 [Nitratireductor indicus C115]|uniref:Uncharacterized protein n=1 Tax=Nitratireductor indicus C115 TaxID=1231190 RepID=K2PQI8_9HYPH|nr:hypothetical protein [Nitratireductor indicus]EKF43322.1 hypothetical protein NA8A_04803 [Nitratireductor indicus C115]SFQ10065.1 hypothetical protein SAMN05216176_101344 [Nitratireductor indicus]